MLWCNNNNNNNITIKTNNNNNNDKNNFTECELYGHNGSFVKPIY